MKPLFSLFMVLLIVPLVSAGVTTELQTEYAPCPRDSTRELGYYTSWYTVEDNDPALTENVVYNTFQVDVQGEILSGESAILPDVWFTDAVINGKNIPGGFGGSPLYQINYEDALVNGVNTITVRSVRDLNQVYPHINVPPSVFKSSGEELWSMAIVVCMPHEELVALGAINPNYPGLPVEVPEFGTIAFVTITIIGGVLVVAVRRK